MDDITYELQRVAVRIASRQEEKHKVRERRLEEILNDNYRVCMS